MIEHKIVAKVSIEGRTADNLFHLLSDSVEMFGNVTEREIERQGLKFNKTTSALRNRLKYTCIDIRRNLLQTKMTTQEEFGEDADELYKLIVLYVDRVGDNKAKIDMVLKFIKSINSEMNMNLKKFGIYD